MVGLYPTIESCPLVYRSRLLQSIDFGPCLLFIYPSLDRVDRKNP